jgi:hypothetical protein
VPAAVRARAEGLLKDGLVDMRLGDRVTLARLATPALLPQLLADAEKQVVEAALINPRLREEDVTTALRPRRCARDARRGRRRVDALGDELCREARDRAAAAHAAAARARAHQLARAARPAKARARHVAATVDQAAARKVIEQEAEPS